MMTRIKMKMVMTMMTTILMMIFNDDDVTIVVVADDDDDDDCMGVALRHGDGKGNFTHVIRHGEL